MNQQEEYLPSYEVTIHGVSQAEFDAQPGEGKKLKNFETMTKKVMLPGRVSATLFLDLGKPEGAEAGHSVSIVAHQFGSAKVTGRQYELASGGEFGEISVEARTSVTSRSHSVSVLTNPAYEY